MRKSGRAFNARRITRWMLGVAVAAAALCAFGSATAMAVSISPTGAITATSNGRLTHRMTLQTSQCNWSMIGTIDRSSGSAGDQIGSITSTRIYNCLGGIAMADLIATRGAWPIRISAQLGTSPVTGLLVVISNWAWNWSSPPCLFTGAAGMLVTQLSGGTNQMSFLTNTFTSACGSLSFSGSFTISPGLTIA